MAPATIQIGNRGIGADSPCFVIAEIGHNHQGSLERAKEMLVAAHECGVDAVKLQKRNNRRLYTRAMYNKPYENENSYGATYGEHREYLEFGQAEYEALAELAHQLGLEFFATAFDFESADFLQALGVPAFKIASGDLNNVPLLRHVAGFQKPMIVSTGGGTLADVRRAYEAILPINAQLCLLQCTAAYPAAMEDLNLRVIPAFEREFPAAVIGFSSHDNGIAMPLIAYALGARVIEKHFTLDRAWKGTDQAFSLERPGMQRLVRDLHNARRAMGDGLKLPHPTEIGPLQKMGKKLVAARDLPAQHRLVRSDIAIKSPADGGLPPYELDHVIGRILTKPVAEDDNLGWEALAPAEPGQ
ncbi:MAG: N-acetylneuraminate synthase family protein [Anaerolineales bacterium]|nr:N-acetylneuraminate synthase family protein [Anaerolineales bacterium]